MKESTANDCKAKLRFQSARTPYTHSHRSIDDNWRKNWALKTPLAGWDFEPSLRMPTYRFSRQMPTISDVSPNPARPSNFVKLCSGPRYQNSHLADFCASSRVLTEMSFNFLEFAGLPAHRLDDILPTLAPQWTRNECLYLVAAGTGDKVCCSGLGKSLTGPAILCEGKMESEARGEL